MKKPFALLVLLLSALKAMAGAPGGVGGATEFTQIANNVQLVMQYEQQIAGFVRQGLQLEAELKNLIQNPTSLLGQDIGNLINDVGAIMRGGKAIGSNMAEIDRNFANTFKNQTAQTLADRFTSWHATSTDTLERALSAVGKHRDQFKSDSDALKGLYNESQATVGNLQAVQSLAKINSMQVQQLQKLQDLMSTQYLAESTYMSTKMAKEQETLDKSQQQPIVQYEMPKPSKSKY